jgi:hypothetical protein
MLLTNICYLLDPTLMHYSPCFCTLWTLPDLARPAWFSLNKYLFYKISDDLACRGDMPIS